MIRRYTNAVNIASSCLILCVCLAKAQEQTNAGSTAGQENLVRIAKQVRKAIVTLPQYGVFDNIHFAINPDGVVILRGEASRPTLKSSAENVVKKVEGVQKVDNQIEVLPNSPNDDRIRRAVYRAIYSHPTLDRYGLASVPSIHIIVKNGNVALEGVVDNESDRNLATIKAKEVPGIFSLTNNLVGQKS